MNTEKNTQSNRHISFRKLFTISGLIFLFIFQTICFGLNIYFGQQQIEEMNRKDAEILHSAIADKFSEIYYNIELAKTFLDQNKQLYYNENVNLLSSNQEEKVYLETMERLKKLVVSPNIIDSILVIGKDSNQRSLFYSSSTRKCDVESYPTWDVMQEVGLVDEIL